MKNPNNRAIFKLRLYQSILLIMKESDFYILKIALNFGWLCYKVLKHVYQIWISIKSNIKEFNRITFPDEIFPYMFPYLFIFLRNYQMSFIVTKLSLEAVCNLIYRNRNLCSFSYNYAQTIV